MLRILFDIILFIVIYECFFLQYVILIVDYCLLVDNVEGEDQDRSFCEISGLTRGENIFFNVNVFLQMGGRYVVLSYLIGVISEKFKGCVRNMRYNGEVFYNKCLYNLWSVFFL